MTLTHKHYQEFSRRLKMYYNIPIPGIHKLDVINIWLNFDNIPDKVITVKQFSNGKFGQPTSYENREIQSLLDNTDYDQPTVSSQCPTCGDHDCNNSRPCETGDGE